MTRVDPGRALQSLAHHIDLEFLKEAYRRTRKSGAVGVDGTTAAEYARNLDANLQDLLNRFKTGTYRAPPVRRVHIPKGDGSKTRPIGIPTFEDKVLQRAVTMVLDAVYEEVFLPCSFGFRPGRSAHDALEVLWRGLRDMRGGWVLEVDIKGFFDALVPSHLRAFLDRRVVDGVLRRTINKWLKAGVQEDGEISRPSTGSPQGGVISPVLANVYLHYVLDEWFEEVVRPRLAGRALLVRYADDFVIVFDREEDARRVERVLPKRFGKYGLTLHPDKTKLVPFQRPPERRLREPGDGPPGPGTFDLLGFTHHWGRARKGYWVVKRKTAKNRFTRARRAIWTWCRDNRHRPLEEQHRLLSAKLRGHCQYYGLTGNSNALVRFKRKLMESWRYWLNRRSRRANMTWERFTRVLERLPLPAARAVHSHLRLAAKP